MIEKEQILLLTQGGLNVFSHFLGFEVNLHRNFRSPFYEDRRALKTDGLPATSIMIGKVLPTSFTTIAIPLTRGTAFGLWLPYEA